MRITQDGIGIQLNRVLLVMFGLIFLLAVSLFSQNMSDEFLTHLKQFEGFRARAYYCPANVLTIGYGHTGRDVYPGMVVTKEEAERLLRKDLIKFEQYVIRRVPYLPRPPQFDALVDHSYNVGSIYGGLYKAVIERKYELAARKLRLYIRADGRILKGLVRRANFRADWYLKKHLDSRKILQCNRIEETEL